MSQHSMNDTFGYCWPRSFLVNFCFSRMQSFVTFKIVNALHEKIFIFPNFRKTVIVAVKKTNFSSFLT